MGTIIPIIGSFGLLALIVGCLMFIPTAAFKKRRRFARKMAIGGGIVFVLAMILDPSRPVTKSANDPIKSTAAPSPPAKVASEPNRNDQAESESQFIALYRRFIGETKPCDRAVKELGRAANGGDRLATYQAAKDGKDTCRQAADVIGNLDAPDGLNNEGTVATQEAIKTCGSAYRFREKAMENAMQVADGDDRPSVISEMVDNLKTGQAGTVLCVSQFFAASSKSGIDIKKLAE